MVNHLKLFRVEQAGPAIVVIPVGQGSSFLYRDLHVEANVLRGYLLKSGCKHLVLDMHEMDYCGSEFIGSLVSMLRETRTRGGKAFFCDAQPQMYRVLENMSLFKLWPYHATREEALAAA